MTNHTNSTLYTGVTNDLIKRVYQHKNKLVDGFTKKYNLNKLVYFESFNDPVTAITKEKSIKNLLRSKKNDLINKSNPDWKDLYETII